MRRIALVVAFCLCAGSAAAQTVKEGLDAVQRGERERARVVFEALAGGNDREAQYQLALLYEQQYQSIESALFWYRRAAEAGHPQALNDLGVMYYEGRGVPKDPKAAYALYLRAAEGGLAAAQYNVALMLGRGDNVPPDVAGATRWLEKAAAAGYDKAQAQLGRLYLDGSPQETRRGVALLEQAAAKGNPWGQYFLGEAMLKGIGTPRNLEAANKLFAAAAAQGNTGATYRLAVMSELGMGEPADESRARDLYLSAAEQGNVEAIRRLVRAYREGGLTLRPDPQRADAWSARLPADKK